MKREIRPGEYEGILKKLRDAPPPEDLFNEVVKSNSKFKRFVLSEKEKWKEVTELLIKGTYPNGYEGRVKNINCDFESYVRSGGEGGIRIRLPIYTVQYGIDYYDVESRKYSSFDRESVIQKEGHRKYWVEELEKSNAIGITTPLSGEQYTSLFDCCTPISVEYLEKMVEEAKDMPDITPEMVYEYVKQCYDAVYKDSLIIPTPTPAPAPKEKRKLSWFERLF